MHIPTILPLLAAAVTTITATTPPLPLLAAENAPATLFIAEFQASNNSLLRGSITLQTAAKDNVGADVSVTLNGLEQNNGPFDFHIHKARVPADGNCTATTGHYDPMGAGGGSYKCNVSTRQFCEIGDLSGKWGAAPKEGGQFSSRFTDVYLGTNPTGPNYVGNLSVVVHSGYTGYRIACANLVLKSGSGGNGSANGAAAGGSPTGSNGTNVNTGKPSDTPSPDARNSAHKAVAGFGALIFAAVAFVL